jgi:hypothetical protein
MFFYAAGKLECGGAANTLLLLHGPAYHQPQISIAQMLVRRHRRCRHQTLASPSRTFGGQGFR